MEVGNLELEHLLCVRENLLENIEKNNNNNDKMALVLIDYRITVLRSEEDEKGNSIKCS
jgi:hypothetical protein